MEYNFQQLKLIYESKNEKRKQHCKYGKEKEAEGEKRNVNKWDEREREREKS